MRRNLRSSWESSEARAPGFHGMRGLRDNSCHTRTDSARNSAEMKLPGHTLLRENVMEMFVMRSSFQTSLLAGPATRRLQRSVRSCTSNAPSPTGRSREKRDVVGDGLRQLSFILPGKHTRPLTPTIPYDGPNARPESRSHHDHRRLGVQGPRPVGLTTGAFDGDAIARDQVAHRKPATYREPFQRPATTRWLRSMPHATEWFFLQSRGDASHNQASRRHQAVD